MKFRNIYFLISLVFLVPGVISLAIYGLKPSIDFTGGSVIEFQLDLTKTNEGEVSRERIQEVVGEDYPISSLQKTAGSQYVIKGPEVDNAHKDQMIEKVSIEIAPAKELRFEKVGATISQELIFKTISAIVLVAGLITVYVWKQFHQLKFGISAILAMLHDSLILLGAFSLLGVMANVQVDILFVTALLTTLSFSIHDTIVVFDRIRELKRKNFKEDWTDLVNKAVTETLSRSINNSITIIVMLLSLFLLGGETIRMFALALLIGAVTGTYSSTFTAAPLLLLWDEITKKRKAKVSS